MINLSGFVSPLLFTKSSMLGFCVPSVVYEESNVRGLTYFSVQTAHFYVVVPSRQRGENK